ncbi:MAG: paraslipin [Sphingobacteriia bacterium]|nr:paraslipin [Sphingobacteriia bacterium]
MFEIGNLIPAAISVIVIIALARGIKIVPQQEAWIIEKLGKFDRKLEPGLNFLVPFIERVAYYHSLKEQAIEVREQTAITKDNVTLAIDGVLYVKIIDPIAASYGVNDPYYAITQLAQTTMRSEIGKMTLDRTFEERDTMNYNIVQAMNQAATNWGIQCMRYEIKDIKPPSTVLKAMELQVAADRQKRAQILESEGHRQSQINIAEGFKQEIVLKSEANLTEQVNRAKGEAEAVSLVASATAKSLELIGNALNTVGGNEAANLKIAQNYIDAFKEIAQKSTTVVVPSNLTDLSGMITQATTLINKLSPKDGKQGLINEAKEKAKQVTSNKPENKTSSPWE